MNVIKICGTLLLLISLTGCAVVDRICDESYPSLCRDYRLPSDAFLEHNFTQKVDSFEKLVEMFKKDSEWGQISSYSFYKINQTYTADVDTDEKLEESRYKKYSELFDKTGVRYGIARERLDPNTFYLQFASVDVDNKDNCQIPVDEKGYAYSEKELLPLNGNLNNSPVEGLAFKRINRNWYIFYRMSIRKCE